MFTSSEGGSELACFSCVWHKQIRTFHVAVVKSLLSFVPRIPGTRDVVVVVVVVFVVVVVVIVFVFVFVFVFVVVVVVL